MCKTETAMPPANTEPPMENDVFTGTTFSKDTGELSDFLWVMNDEPHASRRKEMIKKHPDIKDLMGHEPMTKYIVIVLMAIQLSAAYLMKDEAPVVSEHKFGTVKFWLTSYIVGATISQALFLACHEISHNLAFRKFNDNKLFGIFTNIPMLIPFFMYFKFYHNEHHKYQGVEGVDTDLPTDIEATLLSNFFGKLFFLSMQIWFYAFRPIFVKAAPLSLWHALNYAVQGGFIGGTIYFFGPGPIIYLLASIHFAGSLHPMASHFIAEHYVFQDTKDETFSYYGPLNKLAWNVGYHNEHHDFPTVPWSRLPEVYQVGREEWYDKMPFHKSWTQVMVKFLLSGKVNLYNRVKRPERAVRMGKGTKEE